MQRVGIVILNYKNYSDTMECLDSLFAITYPDCEIIVVDNDSRNDSFEIIARALSERRREFACLCDKSLEECVDVQSNIILFQSPSNAGYAAGNNWGIRIALMRKVDYVLVLNNDTIVKEGFLEPLVAHLESSSRIGAVGPKVLNVEGGIDYMCARGRPTYWSYCYMLNLVLLLFSCRDRFQFFRGNFYQGYLFDAPMQIDIMSGSCMLFKRMTFERIGLMDENTFLYLEEFIIGEKMRNEELLTYIVPESVIVHKIGKSTKSENNKFLQRTLLKSRRYYMKNYRGWNWFQREILIFKLPFIDQLADLRRRLLSCEKG